MLYEQIHTFDKTLLIKHVGVMSSLELKMKKSFVLCMVYKCREDGKKSS